MVQPGKHRPQRSPNRHREQAVPQRGRGGAGTLWLYGRHTVMAALANPRRQIDRVLATEAFLQRFGDQMAPRAKVESAEKEQLDRLVGPDAVHQGVAAQARPLAPRPLDDLLAELDSTAPLVLLVLDEVTDPRNVGAILRSAAAFGAAGIVVTRHNAAEETGALAKAASGALDRVPIATASNLRQGIEQLKAAAIWCMGLTHPAPAELGKDPPPGRLAWVLGAEGKGLRPLTARTCDGLVSIPIAEEADSLNVSNAAAIALYEWARHFRR